MQFEAEHWFNGSPRAVATLMTNPQFYESLALPDVSKPEVLETNADDQRSRLRLRYEFIGGLDATARRLIGGNRLAWIQEVVVEHVAADGEVTYSSVADTRRLRGSAHFDLQANNGRCVRRLKGELVVAVPLIGPRVEQKIVPGMLRRLDIEAEAINNALAENR